MSDMVVRMGVDIRLLGGFSVAVAGETVSPDAWRNRRAADLVKLLAIEPGRQLHRDQIMEALWPGLTADAAAANLRKSVHHARRVLGSPDRLESRGGLFVLCPDEEVAVDLHLFERDADAALESGDPAACLRAAASFAEVLPADRYEDWSQDVRSRARGRHLALLAAAGEWQKILDVDPTDEVAHRALMQGYLDAGNRRDAVRQFERLRDALRDHLGVGPDQATVELYDRALSLAGAEPPTPVERIGALHAHGSSPSAARSSPTPSGWPMRPGRSRSTPDSDTSWVRRLRCSRSSPLLVARGTTPSVRTSNDP
jgi:DNA-binding SARP family transcriptional activator